MLYRLHSFRGIRGLRIRRYERFGSRHTNCSHKTMREARFEAYENFVSNEMRCLENKNPCIPSKSILQNSSLPLQRFPPNDYAFLIPNYLILPIRSRKDSLCMPVYFEKSRAFACHSPIFARAFALSNPAASSIAAFFL